ncbi:MAG: hypothetical protein NC034_01955 [Ruminococcus sp.]|nr:hypothetical protein [Ruminococcus sp.]
MEKEIYRILNKIETDDIECEPLSETEVNNIMKKFNDRRTIKKSAGKKRRFILATAAAAAIVILIPTSAYAYNKIADISKTAKYRNTITIHANTSESSEKQSDESSKEQLMDFEFGWLPEGFTKPDNDWHYSNGHEAIGPMLFRIPDDKDHKIDMLYSSECETLELDGKTAMINYRLSYNNGEKINFGRDIWVSFDDTKYLLRLYLTDGISQEDTKKILENIKLVPTDEVCFSTILPWDEEEEYIPPEKKDVDLDKCDIYKIGDTVSYTGAPEENSGYSITINSAEFTDSFEGINTDELGQYCDYSELMDENGNIIENTRQYIKPGDGIETLDEVVKEENIPMHILKLNVTYTNIADVQNEIGIDPTIINIRNGNFYYLGQSDTEYIICDTARANYDIGGHFSIASEKMGSKNYVVLEPGESAEVEIAFCVADDETDDLYTFFRMEGNNLSFALQHDQCPIYDLNQ